MTDWKWILAHQPRRQYNNLLNTFHIRDYNSLLRKEEEDGVSLYYYRNYGFPSPMEFIKMGQETFDVALSLKGDVAVDVGAHVGSYAIRLAKNFRRVYAFEANPQTYRILLRNIDLNHAENIVSRQIAVSDRREKVNLRIPTRSLPGSTVAPTHYQWVKFTHQVPVEADSLDNLLAQVNGRIGFVKIDVENHELAVLEGMKDTIQKHHPILSVEAHRRPDTLTSCNCQVCEWLRRAGGLKAELHGRYTSEMEAHWIIASPD